MASAFPGPEVLPNFFCIKAAAANAAAFWEAEFCDMAGTVAAPGLVLAKARSCATCTTEVHIQGSYRSHMQQLEPCKHQLRRSFYTQSLDSCVLASAAVYRIASWMAPGAMSELESCGKKVTACSTSQHLMT